MPCHNVKRNIVGDAGEHLAVLGTIWEGDCFPMSFTTQQYETFLAAAKQRLS